MSNEDLMKYFIKLIEKVWDKRFQCQIDLLTLLELNRYIYGCAGDD